MAEDCNRWLGPRDGNNSVCRSRKQKMEIKGNDEHETDCANVQKERAKSKKSARHKCLLMQLKKLECHLVST